MTSSLHFSRACIGYGAARIVEDATLVVAPGEVVGLVGPNGAGKSTLLRAITGEADLFAGDIDVAGTPIRQMTARERARVVGVVPQQVTVAFSFSAEAFVGMGRHPYLSRFGSPGEHDRAQVERAMRLTDTAHLAQRPVDALSGGDLQRLALAQALAQEPQVLLLDEPTSHLDLNHRLQVLDLVRDLASDGISVLAVFHDLDLAARYSDRVAVVSDGRVSAADSPERVIDADMLRRVFGVRAVVGIDPVTGTTAVTPVLRDGAVAAHRRGRLLVVGGSGVASPLLRQLVLDGWQVSAAALNAGDTDAHVAEALGVPFAHLAPFAPMDEDAAAEVRALAAGVDAIVVCDVPFGHGNVENLGASVGAGVPIVLVGGIEGRDYTGGRAEALWAAALNAGAVEVANADGVRAALDSLLDKPDAR
ncbi:MAG TPA: ABC transporter ATP-binding protein [Coriobacteriia bacterium]|nr:ABC transporter ATP-binding protein [Coriobacteriia bacterium]